MEMEYNNLYTHFILFTLHRQPIIEEKQRQRIEKYITGIVNHNDSHLYSIYANPEHVHFLISRSPNLSEENIATIVAESSERFINENKLCDAHFQWQNSASAFSVSKSDVDNDPSKGALITIENKGKIILPVILQITLSNGEINTVQLPVEIWQRASTWVYKYASTNKIDKVILDPEKVLPDIDRKNNEWNK